MAHGITEIDRGFVQGDSTWHKLPQYIVIPDRSITIKECVEVADYAIETKPLFWQDDAGEFRSSDGAHCIVRPDHKRVLVPAVGNRFFADTNVHMVNRLSETLLAAYPDLKIESAGTLFGGATFFLNLRVGEFRVKGDKSATLTNLMFTNPLGRGQYIACAHNTRIVCNNTEQIAESQGLINNALKKFRHTSGAKSKIQDYLFELADLKLQLKQRELLLDALAGCAVSVEQVDKFLDTFFSLPEDDGRSLTMAKNGREAFTGIFDGTQTHTMDNPHTKYGLYMAYTDWVDHEKRTRGSDLAATMFDGITGTRAASKQDALDYITVM
jgi:phage/plasmid-like protein (TIGR03299 family)